MSAEIPAVRPGTNLVPSARIVRPGGSTPLAGTGAQERSAPGSPRALLDRSGIDLHRLLVDGDGLVERTGSSRVELTVRLEAARGALVRNQPTEVLALLDDSWEAAQHTEQGWYLRGSALAALGLPGEAVRVAAEALLLRPRSVALRFLASLAQLLVGDNAAARALLQEALVDAPDETLLLAHYAVVLSRAGHREHANRLLQQAMLQQPDHPAVQYARAWITSDRADMSRRTSREVPGLDGDETVNADWDVLPTDEHGDSAASRRTASTRATGADSLEALIRRVGTSLREGAPVAATLDEVRALLRALSTGGSLVTVGNPDQAHAARSLLTTLLTVWTSPASQSIDRGPGSGAPNPGQATVAAILLQFRDGRMDEARRLLIRSETAMPSMTRALLRALFGEHEPRTRSRASGQHAAFTPSATEIFTDRARHDAHRGVIGPVRLGLALIDERPNLAPLSTREPLSSIPDRSDEAARVARASLDAGHGPVGWDAVPPPPLGVTSSSGVRIAAVCCVLAAIAAMAAGKAVIALALAGGATWLAIRRVHRLHDTAEYHTAEQRIRDTSR